MKRVAGKCTTLQNEEFHNLCSSHNIISVIKSRKIKYMEHVILKGEFRMYTKYGE
jgi:hypothetical protein